ncbi:unnamed protein product [Sphagnum troendelagicum]|uniref:Uncharacterized protein n=1 Tax=Sphagnum troendelagicum TaxID=128251 RepID=A0ABP0T8R3_9BRYO
MAEDAMEVAMEVDEASTSHKADSSSEGQREDVWYFPTAAHRWSLVEKYRPTSLADVAAHTDIIDTICLDTYIEISEKKTRTGLALFDVVQELQL